MVVFGKQCFEYVLERAPHRVQEVYLAKEVAKPLFERVRRLGVPILRVDNKRAQALARGKNHQGVFARITPLEPIPLASALDYSSMVVLCGVSDVGNIGAIVRTAYALGVSAVVVSDRDKVEIATLEGILRTSSGALLELPLCFHKSSLDVAHESQMRGFTLIGAGRNRHGAPLVETPRKWALFIGREDSGLSSRLASKLDCILHITMQHGFDSLNASVATGILIDRIQHIKKEYYGKL